MPERRWGCRRVIDRSPENQVKSSQVYFFNSRLLNYTTQNYTIKSTTKYTEKNLLIQSIDNLTENTELKM